MKRTDMPRERELQYRHGQARSMALRALADDHPNEYRERLREAKAKLADERGPLPPLKTGRVPWAFGDEQVSA